MKENKLPKLEAMSTLSTWLYHLENLHNQTIDLGLSRVSQVAQRMSLDKPSAYVFTVAGTNGKGTTCRALEMILIEAGYKVGVYSSPHFLRYTERVRIQNSELPEQEHVDSFSRIEQERGDISLTYFEFSTLSALQLFKKHQVDIIILEVGLGGRLDATNIIDSDMAIITSIAIDHVDWLGDNEESIGREKAGIFRQNKPAIVGQENMPESILTVSKLLNTPVYSCEPNKQSSWSYHVENNSWGFLSHEKQYVDLPLPLIPIANAATALAALSYSSLSITENAIINGLKKTALFGRFQIIKYNPMVILDVAHNPHAAKYLNGKILEIKQKRPNGKIKAVIGMLKDKDIAATLANLTGIEYWYCASLSGPRAATSEELTNHLPIENTKQYASVVEAWREATKEASPEDTIIVCGSFYTVAAVMEETCND